MKSQIKRFSKSTLSVILSLCMLVSCMTVGIIATDAAQSADERVGETTYYFRGSSNEWGSTALTSLGDGYYYYANQVASGVTFKITDNTSWDGSEWNKDNIENSLGDVTNLTADGSNVKTAASCYIMFNPTENKIWAVKNKPTSAAYYKQMAQVKYGAGTAHEMKYGRVFFDNTTSNWSVNKVYLVVGHGSYVKAYAMNALTNTKLYGYALNDNNGFGDAKYIAFVGTNSTGISSTYTGLAQNKTFTELLKDNRSNITYSSQLFTDTSPALNNSNNTYPFTSGSAGDSCSLTGTWSSNTPNTYFNKTQTINIYTNKASSSAGGSVTKSGYAVSSTAPYTSSTSTTGTAPVLTSTYTLTASANDGYTFDGWYSDSACTTKLTSDTTYSYTVTGTKTVYANFNKLNETYTSIAVAAKGSTDGSTYNTTLSGTPATISANQYTTGTSALTITAGEVSGYSFAQWKVTAGSGTIGSATTASTTFTPSASNTTVTAQYKKNYTISDDTSDSNGTISFTDDSVNAGDDYTVNISPNNGYVLDTLTVGGTDVTSSVSNNSYTGTASGSSSSISVVATFKAIPETVIFVSTASSDTKIHIWYTNTDGTSKGDKTTYPGDSLSTTQNVNGETFYKYSFYSLESNFKIVLNIDGDECKSADSSQLTIGNTYYVYWDDTAGSELEISTNPPEQKYTVTVQSEDNSKGTVSGTVSAGATTAATLPTPTPADGYKFKEWITTDSSIEITNSTSATGATVKATAAGTVTATFEPNQNLKLYIAGRFRVRPSEGSTSWTTTYASGSDWNDTSTNIPFTYLSGTTYKVDTYATLAELSAKIGSSTYTGDPVFFVYDTTNNKNWFASSATTMSTTGTTLVSSGGANSNLKFSSTSTDSPVTIYYDANSHKIWYYVPTFYDITVTSATGGTVTAKPARATEGSAITLEVEPNDHYRLESISAVQNGVSGALQLTETEDGYSFTMPAGNVTVTPTFTPTTYTNISYSARGSQSENAKTDYTDATYTEVLNASLGYSNSATYITGRGLTAPDYSGYAFYKWVATGGVFDKSPSAATPNESTSSTATFYPTQDGAQVKALYRKSYSLTTNSPSGGTIAVSTNTCYAGDQYVVTLSPAQGKQLSDLTKGDISVKGDVALNPPNYTYTAIASGSVYTIHFVVTYKDIEDTVVYVHKSIFNRQVDPLRNAYIWYNYSGNIYTLDGYDYPGEDMATNNNWEDDTDYPDYKKREFKLNFGDFNILFNTGATPGSDSNKTKDSTSYPTGATYYINSASINEVPVLSNGEPPYTIVGAEDLVGSNWNTGDTNNNMTYKDTVSGNKRFSLTKSGTVSKSSNQGHGYKVVTSHSYDYGQYPGPGANQYIPVLYNNSTVEFIYTPATQSLTATVSGGTYDVSTYSSDAQNGASYISSTDSDVATTDTTVTLNGTNTYDESNYSDKYTPHTVYVKALPNTHYEVVGWEDGNGATLTPSSVIASGDTKIATFSVTTDTTIIPKIQRKVHTVTFTNKPVSGTNNSVTVNNQSSSPQNVNEWDNYTILVTPINGYMIKSFTINGSDGTTDCLSGIPETDNRRTSAFSYTRQMKYANETISVTFERVGYTLTGKVFPEHGHVNFYSDASCSDQDLITEAKVGDTIYAKYFSDDDYVLKEFEITGRGADITSTTGNIATISMGSSNLTVTAKVMLQYDVKYYVDMHSTNMTGKTVQVAVVSSNGAPLKDKDGADCTGTLSQEGDTSVYSGSITTPFDTGTGTIGDLRLKITYNSNNYNAIIPAEKVNALKSKATKEIWFETQNEPSYDLKYTNKTKSTPTVSSGYRRIYLAKPVSRESDWTNIRLYYWSDNNINNGWDGDYLANTHMTWLGQDASYHYYYVDIPKNDNLNNDKSKFNNFVFQGCSKNDDNDTWTAVKTQSDDIYDAPDSANYYILANSGKGITQGEDVVIPSYTQYRDEAWMNVDVYDTFEPGSNQIVSIMPTYTGGKIIFDISNEDQAVVTVDENGKLTPHSSGIATINVKIFGTIGKALNDFNSNLTEDSINYDVTVHVSNPGNLSNFNVMAIESAVYTVTIPTVSGTQPAYFDMNKVEMVVEGIKGATKSNNSAIINYTGSSNISSFTVKYAKANSDFNGYDNIRITGTIVTDSVRYSGGARYGHKQWDPSPQGSTTTVKINNGVETATTKNFLFDKSVVSKTYQDIFETYEYVDVTFNFDYYEYVPKVEEDGMINYPYDAAWAGTEDRFNGDFIVKDGGNKEHHKLIQHQVTAYEVRGITKADLYNTTISSDDLTILVNGAAAAMGEMPSNNYYSYLIDKSSDVIPPGKIAEVVENQTTNDYAVSVNVHMKHKLNYYHVYVNGTEVQNEDTKSVSGKDQYGYTYQSYAEPTVQKASDWYAVDASTSDPHGENASIDNAPLLATNVTGYKFRVKGDTYLKTAQASGDRKGYDFLRSEVDFSHYEITHRENSHDEIVDYLLQNFYIADFFSPAEVLDFNRPKTGSSNEYLPYDDAQFVGGGVVYFSVDSEGKPRSNNALALGYVNEDGTINEDAVKQMLRNNIEAQYDADNVSGVLGEEDAMKVAYGTEIEAKQHVNAADGMKSGVLYRYLPLNQYKRDNSGILEKDENDKYTLAYEVNNNTFRYSNTLHSYQYVYASGNENKETNNGRNMRLYSYYVYSYVAYNQETNVPETKYEIVLSDNYSDASTYWAGNPNPNPAN